MWLENEYFNSSGTVAVSLYFKGLKVCSAVRRGKNPEKCQKTSSLKDYNAKTKTVSREKYINGSLVGQIMS